MGSGVYERFFNRSKCERKQKQDIFREKALVIRKTVVNNEGYVK